MVKLVKQFASGIYNLLLGLFTTGKHLGRHAITLQYPKERWDIPERSRGMVVLLTDHETGKLNCTTCLLCMRACPSAAILIDHYKDENKKRKLNEFVVDFNLCCFCGYCEDACNFAAIKLSTKYEFPEANSEALKYNMERLAKAGFDVPYEKPVRKKKPVKKPAPKPDADKPATPKQETIQPEAATPDKEKPVIEKADIKSTEEKPVEQNQPASDNQPDKSEGGE